MVTGFPETFQMLIGTFSKRVVDFNFVLISERAFLFCGDYAIAGRVSSRMNSGTFREKTLLIKIALSMP
jgi:hypothetical protein